MSIYKGTTLLAGSSVTIPLFTPTWQDHLLNDISWLRADTFSWQSGLVYTAAYQHLIADVSSIAEPIWSTATQALDTGKSWSCGCFNGTKFIAIGGYGALSTSTDGVTWTASTSTSTLVGPSYLWISVVWDGSKFVAIGNYGYFATSIDGETWSEVGRFSDLSGVYWQEVAYNGSKFIAIAGTGHISTSTNGTTWTAPTEIANLGNHTWRSIIWDGSKFVALSYTGYLSTSIDGTSWTPATENTTLGSRGWSELTYYNSKFIALSYNRYLSTSTDGITWTEPVQLASLSVNTWTGGFVQSNTRCIALSSHGEISVLTKLVSETISDTTVSYYPATDGHKIVPVEYETNVSTIYNSTGVAWYYLLDTTNQRFKLPRSKWNFVGLRTSVGTYVEESLPNINITTCGIGETNSMYHRLAGYADSGVARGDGVSGVLTEPLASQVSSTYKDNAPVQQNATEMHLYFYIGQFTQTAIQQTAGITSEALNAKADRAELASKVDLSALTNLCVPDYARCIAGGLITAGTWIQTPTDAQVVVWGTDPYTEDFKALVSPDSGQTQYEVGYRSDDYNGYTQGTSFSFLVPKNWYFTCGAEQGFHYRIYPLKGAN